MGGQRSVGCRRADYLPVGGDNKNRGGVSFPVCGSMNNNGLCVMQRVTGSLSQGAHPGSYNGQDAYNDMLVVDDGGQRGEWATESGDNVRGHKRA